MNEKNRPQRFYVEGVLSFVKGCDVFTFGATNEAETNFQLNQRSENPTTYTKLSCFLPWIAEQYGLDYKMSGTEDSACKQSSGNQNDGDNTCRITPSNLVDVFLGEVECIFPYYYDGKKYENCSLFDEDDFVYPVFRCPILESTEKIDGISSYPVIGLTEGLCPSDPNDNMSPLDPSKECDPLQRRAVFSQCKNNCPGVRAFGIIGGGAALAFVGAAAGVQTLAAVGLGVGGLGVGGTVLAQTMCAPPYCTANSGQCCFLAPSLNGLQCPDSC